MNADRLINEIRTRVSGSRRASAAAEPRHIPADEGLPVANTSSETEKALAHHSGMLTNGLADNGAMPIKCRRLIGGTTR
jgi:hypothetical protein